MMTQRPPRVRVRMSPSAGWETLQADDPEWTHVIDSGGGVWTRSEFEERGAAVRGRRRYVRPKFHGKQLALLPDD